MESDARSETIDDVEWSEVSADELLETLEEEEPEVFSDMRSEFESNISEQRVRETYEEYTTEETDSDNSLVSKARISLGFLINCFINTSPIVRKATVVDIDADDDQIFMTLSGPDNRIRQERNEGGTFVSNMVFDMEDEVDKGRLNLILDKTGASSPEQLEGKTIPVYTSYDSDESEGERYKYELYDLPKSPMDKTIYYISRVQRLLRLENMKVGFDNNPSIFENKSVLLIPTLFFGLLQINFGDGVTVLFVIFSLLYSASVLWTILFGVSNAFTEQSGERTWVYNLIE